MSDKMIADGFARPAPDVDTSPGLQRKMIAQTVDDVKRSRACTISSRGKATWQRLRRS